jgi:hypothetical protein
MTAKTIAQVENDSTARQRLNAVRARMRPTELRLRRRRGPGAARWFFVRGKSNSLASSRLIRVDLPGRSAFGLLCPIDHDGRAGLRVLGSLRPWIGLRFLRPRVPRDRRVRRLARQRRLRRLARWQHEKDDARLGLCCRRRC